MSPPKPRSNTIIVEKDLGGKYPELVEEPFEHDDDWFKFPYKRLSIHERRKTNEFEENPADDLMSPQVLFPTKRASLKLLFEVP